MRSGNRRGGNRPGGSASHRAAETRGTLSSAFAQGAEGERFVAGLLKQLDPRSWKVLHDLCLEDNGWNIDHLVIGPPGIFVIDTKNVRGLIEIAGDDVACDGHPKTYVQGVLDQVMEVREGLNSIGINPPWVQGVLAFVHAELKVWPFPRDVLVVQAINLVSTLANARRSRELSAEEVKQLVGAVREVWG